MMYADAVVACADLVGRAGARSFEIGHTGEDDDPMNSPIWYAVAEYQGTKIMADEQTSPTAAAMALATRLLSGAKCRCGKLVALSDDGAMVFPGIHIDGTDAMETAKAGQCRWRLMGQRWEPSCDAPPLRVEGKRGDLPMKVQPTGKRKRKGRRA